MEPRRRRFVVSSSDRVRERGLPPRVEQSVLRLVVGRSVNKDSDWLVLSRSGKGKERGRQAHQAALRVEPLSLRIGKNHDAYPTVRDALARLGPPWSQNSSVVKIRPMELCESDRPGGAAVLEALERALGR